MKSKSPVPAGKKRAPRAAAATAAPATPPAKKRPSKAPAKAAAPVATRSRAKLPRPMGLLVLGMHRSGTSALTRTLNLLGAALSDDLLQPTSNNPLGFWEWKPAYDLHNELLGTVDSRWDEWTGVDAKWFRSPVGEAYAHRLATLLRRQFGDKPLFAVKDPRLCRLVPLWRRAGEIAKMEFRAVVVIRSPLEVAASLKAGKGTSRSKAMLVWLRHILDAEHDSRGLPRVFLTYDDLLTDWRAAMTKVSEGLDFTWPRWTMKAEREIDEFLSGDNRHHQAGELSASRGVPQWVATAYRAAVALSKDRDNLEAMAELDSVRKAFDLASNAFWSFHSTEMDALRESMDQRRAETSRELKGALGRIETLTAERAAREQEISAEAQVREAQRLQREAADKQAVTAAQAAAEALETARVEARQAGQVLKLAVVARQAAEAEVIRLIGALKARDAADAQQTAANQAAATQRTAADQAAASQQAVAEQLEREARLSREAAETSKAEAERLAHALAVHEELLAASQTEARQSALTLKEVDGARVAIWTESKRLSQVLLATQEMLSAKTAEAEQSAGALKHLSRLELDTEAQARRLADELAVHTADEARLGAILSEIERGFADMTDGV